MNTRTQAYLPYGSHGSHGSHSGQESWFDRTMGRAAWLLWVACLLWAMGLGTPARAAYNYTETFMNSTAPGWSFYQSGTGPGPRLTAGASKATGDPEAGPTLDAAGQGWLRMTNLQGNQANSVTFANPVPSINNTITIQFEAVMWKPSGTLADGLTFFMYDASQPYDTGSYGGSLGYAQRSGEEGLAGGYFGVGLDTYGNFSNPTEGRSSGTGFVPNAIVVRGPGEEISGQWTGGYDYLAGTGGVNTTVGGSPAIGALSDSLGFNSATRPDLTGADYRAYKITLDASNNLTIAMKSGVSGSFVDLFTANDIGARPDNLRFGFSGSTGGLSQVTEIRNLSVSTTAGANDWTWDNSSGNSRWGTGGSDASNWDKNTNPTTDGGGYTPTVIFDNQFVTSNQTISVRDNNKTLHSMYFGGQYAYTLNTVGSRQLIFNSGTAGGASVIGVYNNAAGNANHTINPRVVAQNELRIQHYVNQTLTFGGVVEIASHALTVDTVGTVNFNSNLIGSGSLTKNGSGQLTLTQSNTSFTGTTVINNGIVRVNNASSLGSSGSASITVNSGGTLQLNLANTTMANKALTLSGSGSGGIGALYNASGNNTYQDSISLASNASIGANAGTTLTVSGAISGSSTLTKVGNGTLTLTANNTGLTGTVVVNAGTLRLNGSGSNKPLGNVSQVVINSGGTVVLAKANQIGSSSGMTLAGGTFNTQGYAQTLGTMTLSANSNLTLGSGALTLSSLVHTGGVLSVTGLNTTTSQWTVTSSVDNAMLGSIYFADLGIMGAFQLADGKIVAAPEPSTYALGLVLVLCAAGYTYRSYVGYSKNHKAAL